MKLFHVEISTNMVVVAESVADAYTVAASFMCEVLGDDMNPAIKVGREVTALSDLKHGWDGECIPYGGDGDSTINELLRGE